MDVSILQDKLRIIAVVKHDVQESAIYTAAVLIFLNFLSSTSDSSWYVLHCFHPCFCYPTAEADSLILGLSYSQRFKGFVVTLLLSVAFFLLAFFVGLPVVVIRPHKFALCFTLGSLCFMGSFAMLRGEL
jgi:ABC-type amino acid transport system permease subunit